MTDPKPDLVQIFNPRSKTYTIVNRTEGRILGHSPTQHPDIPAAQRLSDLPPPEHGPVRYAVRAVWVNGQEASTTVEAHSALGAVWLAAARAAEAGVQGEPSGVFVEVRHG